jgi:hypothetical protein
MRMRLSGHLGWSGRGRNVAGSLAQPGWAGPTVDGLEGRRARPQHQRDRGSDHQGASQ